MLPAAELKRLAQIAAAGFFDDPVMSWVFPDVTLRLEQLEVAFSSVLETNQRRDGVLGTAGDASVAIWLPPDPPEAPAAPAAPADPEVEPTAEEAARAARVAELFTPEIGERFAVLRAAMEAAHPEEPHWYLGVLATVPSAQNRGLGAEAIRPVLERADAEGVPCYLESSNARNLAFYHRHGWVQTGRIDIPDGPTLFPMWRDPAR